jgi:hypothetical protein
MQCLDCGGSGAVVATHRPADARPVADLLLSQEGEAADRATCKAKRVASTR